MQERETGIELGARFGFPRSGQLTLESSPENTHRIFVTNYVHHRGLAMEPTLRIYTLGRLAVYRDEEPVAGFISRKVDALLIYLACNPREHQRETLAELLWNDLSQERALGNLRTVLFSLQQQLAPFLNVTRYAVGMNPDSRWWVDAAALETALDDADQHWKSAGYLSRERIAQLEKGLSVYQGDFLAGFNIREARGFENWKLVEQERLRGRVVGALYRLTRECLERGSLPTGIESARRLLHIDPLFEEGHQLLMLMLAQSGQRSAALAQFETARQVLLNELDVEPAPETVDIYERIQVGLVTPVPEQGPVVLNLPATGTPFVPRPAEMRRILSQFDQPECRLLTLTGPGGIGKTRLAVQAAQERAASFRHGAAIVSLKLIESPGQLAAAMWGALGLGEPGEAPPDGLDQALIDYLQARQMVIVLDRFEHVLDGALFLSTLLGHAPGVKLLITSRERLNVREEWIIQVGLMPVPPDDAPDLLDSEAVQLFARSAQRVQAQFSVEDNRAAVARICRLVQGLPLGIELAASWVHVMPCDLIAAQIEHDLDFLSTSAKNVTEHHRSVSRLIDQSWYLLTDEEKRAMMRLAVFQGTFGLEAAIRVANAPIRVLSALVDQSLIRPEALGRYSMLSLHARFALNRLDASGEAAQARSDHARFFCEWARRPLAAGEDAQAAFSRFDQDQDNLHAALDWAIQQGDEATALGLCVALLDYWRARGAFGDAQHRLERALATPTGGPSLLRAQALAGTAALAALDGDLPRAIRFQRDSLAMSRALGDAEGVGRALLDMAVLLMATGERDAARQQLEEIIAHPQSVPAHRVLAGCHLGYLAAEAGSPLVARAHFAETAHRLTTLGPDVRRATLDGLRGTPSLAALFESVAATAFIRDDHRLVVHMLAAAWAHGATGSRPDRDYLHEACRRVLGAPDFDAAWAEGASLSAEEAVSLAAGMS